MIPNDPVMLLSYVNTQLRDYYSSLDALCEDKGIGKEELVEKIEEKTDLLCISLLKHQMVHKFIL